MLSRLRLPASHPAEQRPLPLDPALPSASAARDGREREPAPDPPRPGGSTPSPRPGRNGGCRSATAWPATGPSAIASATRRRRPPARRRTTRRDGVAASPRARSRARGPARFGQGLEPRLSPAGRAAGRPSGRAPAARPRRAASTRRRRGRRRVRRHRDPRPLRGHQARRDPPHRAAEDDHAPAHPRRQERRAWSSTRA